MSAESTRIDALEMRLAEQERTLDALDAVVVAQGEALDALRLRLGRALDRLAEAESRLPPEPDRPPPHY